MSLTSPAPKGTAGSRTALEMGEFPCFTQGHSLQIFVTLGNQTKDILIKWGHFQEKFVFKNQVARRKSGQRGVLHKPMLKQIKKSPTHH